MESEMNGTGFSDQVQWIVFQMSWIFRLISKKDYVGFLYDPEGLVQSSLSLE